MIENILEMKNITKVYPNGVVANNDVDFCVRKGEIHALMGENGAGKSTLMKILFGIEVATRGNIYINGKLQKISKPLDAIESGIGMVHQHFMQVPSLTVAENMILGNEPTKFGFIERERMLEQTKVVAEKYNLSVDIEAVVGKLPVGKRQKVEILKVLLRGAEIIILDEPTAVLTPQETEELFNELLLLKKMGHTIIFISHKLNEIKEITDRITIMKNGVVQKVVETKKVSKKEISRLMVGRDVILEVKKKKSNPGDVSLSIQNLSFSKDNRSYLNDISFSLRKGEILGIAGVEDNGQSELVDIITGLKKASSGSVFIENDNISLKSVRDIRNLGLAHIHEDRMKFGVSKTSSIEENMISNIYYLKENSKNGLFNMKKLRARITHLINEFQVKISNISDPISSLSGGNIQKVVVAREFSDNPKLIVANQPSRGIDVGTIEFIYDKLVELRDNDSAVLLVSADLNEVLGLSDRLLVMYDGQIVAHFDDIKNVKEDELGEYMLGLKKQESKSLRSAYYE